MYELFGWTALVAAIALGIAIDVIQFVSLVLIVVLRRRRKVWIVPAAAIALTAALCVVSSVIAYKAMLFF